MTRLRIGFSIVLVFLLLALPAAALAAPAIEPVRDDVVIFGSDYTLASGERIDGSLVVFGGNVTVEAGSTVTESVVVFGGNVGLDGAVGESLIVIGGNVHLGASAVVEGDLVNPGGNVESDPGALVRGDQVTTAGPFFSRGFHFGSGSWLFGGFIWMFFLTIAMSAVGVLLTLFIPDHVRRTAEGIVKRPLEAGGLGCLTFILLPFVLVITALTCIFPPVILFLTLLAIILGWAAIGLELGKRLAKALNQSWTNLVEAFIGVLALGLSLALIHLLPVVGWLLSPLLSLFLAALGLGAALLTRFGTRGEPAPLAPAKRIPAKRATRKPASRKKK